MPTTVISVRGFRPDELLADPLFVYVGRGVPRSGWSASPFGNPFSVDRNIEGQGTAKLVVAQFREYLLAAIDYRDVEPYFPPIAARFDEIARKLPTLRGKTLGCWCGTWAPGEPEIACHAVVLAKLADAGEAG